MKNLVPNFQNLVIKEKNFTIFQPQNYLQIFAIFTYFVWIGTLSTYKKKLWLTILDFFLSVKEQLIKNLVLNFQDFLAGQKNFIVILKKNT